MTMCTVHTDFHRSVRSDLARNLTLLVALWVLYALVRGITAGDALLQATTHERSSSSNTSSASRARQLSKPQFSISSGSSRERTSTTSASISPSPLASLPGRGTTTEPSSHECATH